MKFVVTGSTGNISKPLARLLIEAGHEVLVISSDPKKVEEITQSGAGAAIGSIEDPDFLTQAFAGADGVYTMIPPKLDAPNWKTYIHQVTDNYISAIKSSMKLYLSQTCR
ncbi:hypothetical protein GCM10023149_30490 [Mucilaginibacter gynuensis]|uniref:NAD(P)-binding domain-containing protein n=1 Tax=Mucilaginibacter gynuensis TaxID=1302236 RepID=A0ABP8GNN2_9SPHI